MTFSLIQNPQILIFLKETGLGLINKIFLFDYLSIE